MGSPKRIRKKYDKSKLVWDTARINEVHSLMRKYGLKNARELLIAENELDRIRKNAREVLSGRASEEMAKSLIQRLARYNIVKPDASIEDLLTINVEALLARRLQSLIVEKGLAKSMRQARQLVTHGFIAINSVKVSSPGYMVQASEENAISYYKPINLDAGAAGATVAGGVPASGVEAADAEDVENSEE